MTGSPMFQGRRAASYRIRGQLVVPLDWPGRRTQKKRIVVAEFGARPRRHE